MTVCRRNSLASLAAATVVGLTTYFLFSNQLAFVLSIILLFIMIRIPVWMYIRSRERRKKHQEWEEEEADIVGLPTKYPYKDLEAATNNFQSFIGEGGSGSVYKGTLGTDGTHIAVKRINGEGRGRREFKTEMAALANIQHLNLVRLLGYCTARRGFRYLIYEFIQNGSLDSWIFGATDKWLSWATRYQIAIDVAKGLAYLHHECHTKILHLDVKPANVLLDEEFRARVADFGISRLVGRNEGNVNTTVRGTRGYFAPEWFLWDGISEKSDVYSYGVVLFELVTGQRNLRANNDSGGAPRSHLHFPKEPFRKMREGRAIDLVSVRLAEEADFNEEELKVLVGVGLLCMQTKPEHRPSMTDVVDMLERRAKIVDVPPKNRLNIMNLASEVAHESTSSSSGADSVLSSEEEHVSNNFCPLSEPRGR